MFHHTSRKTSRRDVEARETLESVGSFKVSASVWEAATSHLGLVSVSAQKVSCTSLLWISGVLNDMFVSGLCDLASVPFHPQWSRSLQCVYASVCWFHAFGRCCMFLKSLLITFSLFPHQKLYFWNWYNFLIRALSPLLNGTLHHWYIVSALKTIIYHNIICFCLQTSKMNVTLNVIQFSYKN